MHHAGAVRICRQRDLLGAIGMHRLETLAAALEQNSDQIDEYLRIAGGRLDRSGVAQIGLHSMDLPDATERLQMSGKFGPAHRHPDAIVALGQRAHHVAAEKARAAIDGDQGVVWAACGHAALDFRAGDAWKPANTGSPEGCTDPENAVH